MTEQAEAMGRFIPDPNNPGTMYLEAGTFPEPSTTMLADALLVEHRAGVVAVYFGQVGPRDVAPSVVMGFELAEEFLPIIVSSFTAAFLAAIRAGTGRRIVEVKTLGEKDPARLFLYQVHHISIRVQSLGCHVDFIEFETTTDEFEVRLIPHIRIKCSKYLVKSLV